MAAKTLDDLEQSLKKLETDDYQNRGGDYPESDEPDTIYVNGLWVTVDFKNTDEGTARSWTKRYLSDNGFKVDQIYTHQTGDYHNDWVSVSAHVYDPKISESKIINEKLYSMDEVQDMITACRKDKELAKKVVAGVNGARDQAAVRNAIASGWYESFLKYDSAVIDKFITAYEKVSKKRNAVKESEHKVVPYRDYDLDYNLYGHGEYTMHYQGDDIVFDSFEEAKDFIYYLYTAKATEAVNKVLNGVAIREALDI